MALPKIWQEPLSKGWGLCWNMIATQVARGASSTGEKLGPIIHQIKELREFINTQERGLMIRPLIESIQSRYEG